LVELTAGTSGTVLTPPDGMHAGAFGTVESVHGKRVMLLRVILYPKSCKKKRGKKGKKDKKLLKISTKAKYQR
jgi:hypothetical protein